MKPAVILGLSVVCLVLFGGRSVSATMEGFAHTCRNHLSYETECTAREDSLGNLCSLKYTAGQCTKLFQCTRPSSGWTERDVCKAMCWARYRPWALYNNDPEQASILNYRAYAYSGNTNRVSNDTIKIGSSFDEFHTGMFDFYKSLDLEDTKSFTLSMDVPTCIPR